jgi:hypothetical protein
VLFILEVFMKNLVLALALAVGSFAVQADDSYTSTRIGNTDFNSNGSTITHIGDTKFQTNRDGTSSSYTSQQIGNTNFNSDGSSATRIGNTTFTTPSYNERYGDR